jgi:hypothetical protein
LEAIIVVVPTCHEEINNTYKDDFKLQGIIIGKIFNASKWLNYNLTKGILRYKNIIVIGKHRDLRNKLVSFAHGFYIKDIQ